jgi:hypothetical protein
MIEEHRHASADDAVVLSLLLPETNLRFFNQKPVFPRSRHLKLELQQYEALTLLFAGDCRWRATTAHVTQMPSSRRQQLLFNHHGDFTMRECR